MCVQRDTHKLEQNRLKPWNKGERRSLCQTVLSCALEYYTMADVTLTWEKHNDEGSFFLNTQALLNFFIELYI